MKRIAAIVLFIGATLMSASSAMAQASIVKADIPFNFKVNNTFLPAGSYIFSFGTAHPGWLVVQDQKNTVKVLEIGQPGALSQGNPRELIFHCYHGQYFLSQVHFNSASDGVFLPPAKSETKARRGNGTRNWLP